MKQLYSLLVTFLNTKVKSHILTTGWTETSSGTKPRPHRLLLAASYRYFTAFPLNLEEVNGLMSYSNESICAFSAHVLHDAFICQPWTLTPLSLTLYIVSQFPFAALVGVKKASIFKFLCAFLAGAFAPVRDVFLREAGLRSQTGRECRQVEQV